MKLPQIELQTHHIFHGGLYCRILPRPAGTTIVGKVHLRDHVYICTKGRVRVTTDEGVKDLRAGDVLVCKVGTKRAVYAYEDSICMTVHASDVQTVEEAENLVEPEPDSLYGPGNFLRIA